MGLTLYQKIWAAHTVRTLRTGRTQLFVGLHLLHEVTSPQAFEMLRAEQRAVAFPGRTFATLDHVVPTTVPLVRPFADAVAEAMTQALEQSCTEHGIRMFGLGDPCHGIVHIIGPELGLTQPGMTIACGDSHTATHGAFGALAFGIGTSQVRDVMASQCLALDPLRVRLVRFDGAVGDGVFAKDLVLAAIGRLGVNGGVGYAYEFAGTAIESMDMEARMTVCNMAIEGGARMGYVNPDETTFRYLEGRPFAPRGGDFAAACRWWSSLRSDDDAPYDDRVTIDASAIEPMVTWGTNPGQVISVGGRIPQPASPDDELALQYMGLRAGSAIAGTPVNVAFIGSCTNGRLSDLREAARVARGRRVRPGVRALVVPGSAAVRRLAEEEGLADVFIEAGFEWRGPGCSMCLAMNADRLAGNELCASSSNRNFRGRQGSPEGRTMLMSPAMVAAAAITGEVCDVRTLGPRAS
ncbi:MAG: 3-isopropylmalate dehydratase large subunit [Bacteroidales bacterium]